MQRVYTSADIMMVHHLRNVLEDHGIPCLVKNETLGIAAGQLPILECWPELWVVDDGQQPQARELVQEALHAAPAAGPGWTCPGCGEVIEGQFSECWSCGQSRPGDGERPQ